MSCEFEQNGKENILVPEKRPAFLFYAKAKDCPLVPRQIVEVFLVPLTSVLNLGGFFQVTERVGPACATFEKEDLTASLKMLRDDPITFCRLSHERPETKEKIDVIEGEVYPSILIAGTAPCGSVITQERLEGLLSTLKDSLTLLGFYCGDYGTGTTAYILRDMRIAEIPMILDDEKFKAYYKHLKRPGQLADLNFQEVEEKECVPVSIRKRMGNNLN